MNNQTQITSEMLIFIAGIFSLFLIGFTLVVREMVKAMSKEEPKRIILKWVACSEKTGYSKEMIVTYSDHERFVKGSRFDFGFLSVASADGYIIEILPSNN